MATDKSAMYFANEADSLRRSSRSNRGKHSRFEREEVLLGGHISSPVTSPTRRRTAASAQAAPIPKEPSAPKSTRSTRSKTTKNNKKEDKTEDDDEGKEQEQEQEQEQEEEEEEEEEGVVDCICGATEDDGELMAECEDCLKWQHIMCMTGRTTTRRMPAHYYCSGCRPELYPNIEELKKAAIEYHQVRAKNRGRKGRPPKNPTSPATKRRESTTKITHKLEEGTDKEKQSQIPLNVTTRSRKRKSDADQLPTEESVQELVAAPQVVTVASSNSDTVEAGDVIGKKPIIGRRQSRRKRDSVGEETSHEEESSVYYSTSEPEPKKHRTDGDFESRQASETSSERPLSNTSNLIDRARVSVTESLQTLFRETILPKAIELEHLALQNDETVLSVSTKFAESIEAALYAEYGNKDTDSPPENINENGTKLAESDDVGGKYRSNFRTVYSALKDPQNLELRRKITTGEISSKVLVQMKHEDLMNPLLRKLTDSLRAESIRHSIMEQLSPTMITKTHRGEEYLVQPGHTEEDNRPVDDIRGALIPKPDSNEKMEQEQEPNQVNKPVPARRTRSMDSKTSVIASSEHAEIEPNVEVYDIGEAMAKADPGEVDIKMNDKVLDGILAEDRNSHKTQSSHEPANANSESDPNYPIVWTGEVRTSVLSFPCECYYLHGPAQFNPHSSWGKILDTAGAIHLKQPMPRLKIGKYLQISTGIKDIVTMLLRTNEDMGLENKEVRGYRPLFRALYEDLATQDMYGVIQDHYPGVKDAYLITLSMGEEIPDYLCLSMEAKTFLERVLLVDKRAFIAVYVVSRINK